MCNSRFYRLNSGHRASYNRKLNPVDVFRVSGKFHRLERESKPHFMAIARTTGDIANHLTKKPNKAHCGRISIQTLKKRREFAKVSFLNNIVSHLILSVDLLSKLNLYIPSRQLQNRNIFKTNHHRTHYNEFGRLNQITATYNFHCETVDFTMTKPKFNPYITYIR